MVIQAKNSDYYMTCTPQPIVAGAAVLSPYVEPCFASKRCKFPGIDVEVLTQVLNSIGISVTQKSVNSTETYQMLSSGEIDMMAQTETTDSPKWYSAFGQTPTVFEEKPIFLVRKPESQSVVDEYLMFSMYHWHVWLTFAAITFTVTMLHVAMKRFRRQTNLTLMDVVRSVIVPGTSTCTEKIGANNQNDPDIESKSRVGKVLRTLYFITLTVFLGVYTNLLAIKLAQVVRKPILPFTTAQELARKIATKECRLAGYEMGDFIEIFPKAKKQNTSSLSVVFYRANRANTPLNCGGDQECMLQWVRDARSGECRVGVDYMTKIEMLKVKYPQLEVIQDEGFLPIRNVYYYGRFLSDCQKELIGVAFQSGSPSDLYRRLVKEYARQTALKLYFSKDQPQDPSSERSDTRPPLDLDQVKDTFYFFCLGILGSLTAFAVTVAINRHHAAHVTKEAKATAMEGVRKLRETIKPAGLIAFPFSVGERKFA